MGSGTLSGSFADVGHSRSLAGLREALAEKLTRFGVEDLDAAAIRLRAPRRLTQPVSRFVYECTGETQERQFAGIRYLSRLGDNFENWAVFEPAQPHDIMIERIFGDDPDLLAAVDQLGITMVGV